jgi:hypothetical protein
MRADRKHRRGRGGLLTAGPRTGGAIQSLESGNMLTI